MPSSAPTVRLFRRDDRDQLTDLVNAHVAAVVPGVSVSVNTVLDCLTRRPGEFVTDPWVAERVTLVAEHHRCVVAAAHLLRYRDDAEVGADYRDASVVDWFVCRPAASLRPDAERAADLLMHACLAQSARWGVRARYADGALPAPGVYGLPRPWPHVRAVFERAGFHHTGDTEVVLIAEVADLRRAPADPSAQRFVVSRSVGECGTRLTARHGDRELGYIEVDTMRDRPERRARGGGLADIGNLHVAPDTDADYLTGHLLARAAEWLHLAGTERVLDYESAADTTWITRLTAAGFRELARTDRGWEHRLHAGSLTYPT
ncbi:N-acetyltransferase [Embleya sp. NPDC059237]|uniref:N-acetyltransferase n=1 Tax=Embleya sp. NPDC059237 TaxID=3346784 RepID=UPI0036BB29EC